MKSYLFSFGLFVFCSLLLGRTFDSYAQVFSYSEQGTPSNVSVRTGADQTWLYIPYLKGKKVGLVVNPTSVIGQTHLVDTLLQLGVKVVKVFGPEHGFRGNADAGEKVKTGIDQKTSLPVISLYGKNKKPSAEQLSDLDVVVFDIQDVGCRFYTYISTLTYVMEACAVNGKELLILDRPNPNGHFVDGPILEEKFKSFVGLHPVPIVHGCTIGEYAKMVVGENWIESAAQLKMKIIPVQGWNHRQFYSLPVKPSPNLPNMNAIWLYPSLCLFEGTVVSVGRGTDFPFQVMGYPGMPEGNYKFTPKSVEGAKNPPYLDTLCTGFRLDDFSENYVRDLKQIYLFWLTQTYATYHDKGHFFTSYFNTLAGTDQLKKQVMEGKTEEEIRQSWQVGLSSYKAKRKKYLLYTDFE